jgi:hypothetical protein
LKRIQIELSGLNGKISLSEFENNSMGFSGFKNNSRGFSGWANSRLSGISKKSFSEVLFSNRDNLVNTTDIGMRIGDAE